MCSYVSDCKLGYERVCATGRSHHFSGSVWTFAAAAFLAFYAFIGFEDMESVAEEVIEPEVTMPRGILIAIVSSSLL
jgi:amino acid transporter